MKVEIFGSTDVGQVRDHNEDNFVLCKDLASQDWTYKRDEQFDLGALGAVLFVADGMGGTNAGEVASEVAQATVAEEFKKITALPGDDQAIMTFVKKVIVKAHQNIVHRTLEDPTTAGMGTTAVLCWVVNGKAYVAWSGDSRMYLYREGSEFNPITDDHSLVWELVKNGQITAEEARLHENSNIITQSLGDDSRGPKPDAKMVPLHQGDRVMLCSDGLSGMVSDNMLAGILSGRLSTADTCKELIQAANAAGGTDNITVLLLDVLDGKAAPVAPKPVQGARTQPSSGATPINTVISKNGPNKGLIIGGILLLVIAAVAAFFILKPTAGDVETDATDSLQNTIDTNAVPPVTEPPATTEPAIEETPEVGTPAPSTTTSKPPTTTSPGTNKPNTTTTPGTSSPPGTSGEKPQPGANKPVITPRDSPSVTLPKDTPKTKPPGVLTPRTTTTPTENPPNNKGGR